MAYKDTGKRDCSQSFFDFFLNVKDRGRNKRSERECKSLSRLQFCARFSVLAKIENREKSGRGLVQPLPNFETRQKDRMKHRKGTATVSQRNSRPQCHLFTYPRRKTDEFFYFYPAIRLSRTYILRDCAIIIWRGGGGSKINRGA